MKPFLPALGGAVMGRSGEWVERVRTDEYAERKGRE